MWGLSTLAQLQHNFQSKNAETLIDILEKINEEFENISIDNIKILLRFFSNQIIDEDEIRDFLEDNESRIDWKEFE